MANIPADLRYTEEQEYTKPTGEPGVVQVGITDYAQGELGDVVYVELPKGGASFARRDVFGTIEAVQAVSGLYAPVEGTITRAHAAPRGEPALSHPDRYGSRWDVKPPGNTAAALGQV